MGLWTTRGLALSGHIFRSLPQFRGKGRAALRIGSFLTARGADPIVYCKMVAGHRLRLYFRVQFQCRTYFTGEYDEAKVSTLSSFLRRNGVALDVGANIGFYTVPLARVARDLQAKVVAVEPVAINC